MASSFACFFVVSVALLLQSLVGNASALNSTKYIDTVCQMEIINDKDFCLQTLSANPLAASATSLLPLVKVVICRINVPYAELLMKSADGAAKKVPALTKQFNECQDAYYSIVMSLKSAASELKESPTTANYDTMVCFDQTSRVKNLIEKNKDLTSKSLMEKTLYIEKLLHLACGATEALGGDKDQDENIYEDETTFIHACLNI